jgi:hypothetical protein
VRAAEDMLRMVSVGMALGRLRAPAMAA